MAKLKLLLAAAFMAVLTGFFVWWLGPDLMSDFQYRNAKFETARDLRVTEARCRNKLFVISFCEIKVVGPGVPGGNKELSYLIFGGVGDEAIGLQRTLGSDGKPLLSSRIGMDNLTNRIVSFLVFVGLLAVLTVGGLISMLRGTTE